MTFKVVVTPQAHIDTFEAIEWYSKQSSVTAKRFYKTIKEYYNILRHNPYFQVRYANVRCLPVEKFPYMIHFIVEEERKEVVILGIISTDRDPKIWQERTNK